MDIASVIIIALIAAEVALTVGFRIYDKRNVPDIGCEYCRQPVKLYRTKDRKFWLCLRCLRRYRQETEE